MHNAFRPQTLIEVSAALTVAREDESVGVIILTGQGDKAFCSGGDQRVRGDSGYQTDENATGRFHVTDLHVQMRRCPKPIVAMVAGWAIGGGHVLHVVCDLTIAADNAIFGQVGPRVGSFDGGFGASSLAQLVGMKKAKEIWFLCRRYDARAAAEMGLVNAVVPLADLERETVKWCREMLALSPFALRLMKASFHAARGRLRRHPAARPRHEPVVLRHRGSPGGPRGLQGQASARLRPVPAARLGKRSAPVPTGVQASGLRPQARNSKCGMTSVSGWSRCSRAARSRSSSSRSVAMPRSTILGRMLRMRSTRTVRRECPTG